GYRSHGKGLVAIGGRRECRAAYTACCPCRLACDQEAVRDLLGDLGRADRLDAKSDDQNRRRCRLGLRDGTGEAQTEGRRGGLRPQFRNKHLREKRWQMADGLSPSRFDSPTRANAKK